MTDENPSIMSHVSVGTNNFEKATTFYDTVLATIGAKRIMEHPGAVAYGKLFPEFWVQQPHDGGTAATANGVHFGFMARSKAEVDEFYKVALSAGASDDGAAGPRSDYGAGYYGCFVYDLDGHKIEAMYWDESAQ
ncbi:MAG: glyoxalase [Rhodobiaceae bacterium]|nr:MAG: glyoxalase [Rhodobiaceae bacterium]